MKEERFLNILDMLSRNDYVSVESLSQSQKHLIKSSLKLFVCILKSENSTIQKKHALQKSAPMTI